MLLKVLQSHTKRVKNKIVLYYRRLKHENVRQGGWDALIF